MPVSNTLIYAHELKNSRTVHQDCLYRNIVGRAYYHAFYEIKHHLEQNLRWPITNRKCGVHEQLYSRLNGFPEEISIDKQEKAQLLKNRISKLKKYRTNADYHLSRGISGKEVDYILLESEMISNEVTTL